MGIGREKAGEQSGEKSRGVKRGGGGGERGRGGKGELERRSQ